MYNNGSNKERQTQRGNTPRHQVQEGATFKGLDALPLLLPGVVPSYMNKWLKHIGLIFLLILLLPFFPWLVGGYVLWRMYKNGKTNKKHLWKLISVAAITLFIGSAWTSAWYSDKNSSNQEVPTPTPNHSVSPSADPSPSPTAKPNSFKVSRVIDGDTIELENGQRVRYIGIDTPESVDPRTTVQCYGLEASNKNKELVEGKSVTLEKDVSETDKYGRLLRYVYVDGVFVNDALVKEGYAKSSSYPPDIKYQEQLRTSQRVAMDQKLGLWGSCTATSSPKASATTTITPTGNTDCVIKGNISSDGEKIYHMPGQNFYNKTQIDPNKDERWFCSEDEAVSAGWRKSKV